MFFTLFLTKTAVSVSYTVRSLLLFIGEVAQRSHFAQRSQQVNGGVFSVFGLWIILSIYIFAKTLHFCHFWVIIIIYYSTINNNSYLPPNTHICYLRKKSSYACLKYCNNLPIGIEKCYRY